MDEIFFCLVHSELFIEASLLTLLTQGPFMLPHSPSNSMHDYITKSYGWAAFVKAGLHLMHLYLLPQSGWRGLMLLSPQKLSDQWKESAERGGEPMGRVEAEKESIQSDVQATRLPPQRSRHTFLGDCVRWHRYHRVRHHAAPLNHRHLDR